MVKNASRAKIEYVIFDMDGLLIDSERVYTEVTNNILSQYGKEMTWDIKAGLMGKPEREAAAHLLSFFPDLPPDFTLDAYLDLRRKGQDELWSTVQPLPGAVRLVRHLHQHRIPIAVATGSQRRNYAQKSAHLEDVLFGCFEGRVVCADDGLIAPGRGKPHPDVFLVAAERMLGRKVGMDEIVADEWKIERSKGLVFEDAIPGVQAGKRAGMNVVWVPDANLLSLGEAGPTLDVEQPDHTIRSLEDFKPEDWGLPPFDDTA
ncbi:HAD-like protein [Laetiporus sulphureus 93-53]|uniref:HAD-like protein n=1 Tax=Laetiporus sulphureus 93-53 TaxID=1314785 RepID=A0A165GTI3_9APHY|nr:HAD-like protein [Laetiporus sulphureus 93-53]KZT10791.1 HAD-like protein [Laetiporus sulphureus 93-53]